MTVRLTATTVFDDAYGRTTAGVTPLGAVGSACAIGGSYLYAITKHHEKMAARAAEEAEAQSAAVTRALRNQ